jgi:hypothetical protein
MEPYQPQPYQDVPGRALGIAGLVLGIISVMVAFVPCVGLFSFFPAVVAIVLCIIALSQSSAAKVKNGLAVGGLVCAIAACCIAGLQIYFVRMASTKFQESYIEFEKSGGLDSLSSRVMSLEAVADSLWKEKTK